MKKICILLVALLIPLSFVLPAVARTYDEVHGRDVHVTFMTCTECHVTTPTGNDTLETSPLITPGNALCLACHG